MMHWITLLRHGESEANRTEILQGQIDSPLSECGKLQAVKIARSWLADGVHFDRIVSSPLQRARQTAEIVAEVLCYEGVIEIDPAWMERSFGDLEGLTFSHLRQLDPPVDYYQPYEPIGGNGESQLDLYMRAAQGLQQIVRGTPQRSLVVSHGALIGKALYAVLGITPQGRTSPVFSMGNTTYINLGYSNETRQWYFYGFNNPDEWASMKKG